VHTISNRKYFFIAATIATLAMCVQTVRGDTDIALKSHKEHVDIVGRVATTTISQTYVNYTDRQREISMDFRLPPGGAVSDLAMWVDGLRSPAVLHPRIAAKRIYREIMNARRDPAILEYLGSDTWRLSVFPIMPKKTQKIEFKFTSVLGGAAGDCVYRSMQLQSGVLVEADDFEFAATLRSSGEIKDVKAISDKLGVQRLADRIELGFRTDNRKLRQPVTFAFTPEIRPSNVMSFKGPDGKKYYAAVLDPSWEAPRPEPVSRNMVLVLDASASMKGESFRTAALAVKTILNDLGDTDKFNVIVAGSDVGLFDANLLAASKNNKLKAIKWLASFTPKGGTDIAAALRAVESLNKDAKKTLNVFMISDGSDCVGARKPAKETSPFLSTKSKLPKRPPANCRFFVCAIYDQTYILTYLAELTGGDSSYIAHDNPKKAVKTIEYLLGKTRIPDPITDVTLRQIVAGDSKRAKGRADLTDIGFSSPDPVNGMLVTGLWPGPGKRTIEVALHRRSGIQSTRYVLDFSTDRKIPPETPNLRKVWAHQRADRMWAKLHRADVKIDEVRDLMDFSRTESIVTRAMALLVLESDKDYIQRGIKRPGSSVTPKKSLAQLTLGKLTVDVAKLPMPDRFFDRGDPRDSKTIIQQARELQRRGEIAAAARLFEVAANAGSGQFAAQQQASLINEYLALKSSFHVDTVVGKSSEKVLKAVLKGADWHELVMQTEATGLALKNLEAKSPGQPATPRKPVELKGAIPERPEDKILARKIPKIAMKNAALKDVLAKLDPNKDQFDVRWEKLAAEGIKPSTTINLTMTNATLGEALDSVMDKASSGARTIGKYDWRRGLDFAVDKSGITISSKRDIGTNAYLRTYDVQDLIAYSLDRDRKRMGISGDYAIARGSIRRSQPDDVFYEAVGDNASGPITPVVLARESYSTSGNAPAVFELDDNPDREGRWSEEDDSGLSSGLFDPSAGGGFDTGTGLEGDMRSRSDCVSEMKTLVAETVDRDSWRDAGGEIGDLKEVNGLLLIVQSRTNHKAIAKLLDNLRAASRQRKPIKITPLPDDWEPPRMSEKPEDPFNANGRINQWLVDLLKRAESGKLSKFSSVKVRKIGTRKFAMVCGVWFDTSLTAACRIHALAPESAAHTAVLKADPQIAKYLAIGKYVIVRAHDNSAIYLNADGISDPKDPVVKNIVASLTKSAKSKR
jgi:hypothetical protein